MPITIELPELASQTKANLVRRAEILADPALANLPHRIETDQHGHVLMRPPSAPLHGQRQIQIGVLLHQLLPDGRIVSECPLSTAGGVKAVDVAWLAPERPENIGQITLFERAPEICIEILSASEIQENAPSISTPAPLRFGFVTSTALSLFLSVLIISLLPLLFVPAFPRVLRNLRRLHLRPIIQKSHNGKESIHAPRPH